MSVLKSKRRTSKAEFVNLAHQIYMETFHFIARLSNRYQRLLYEDVMHTAAAVLNNCEEAQNIFPSTELRYNARTRHLLEARSALMALDIHMSHVYEILMYNPQGAFNRENGETVPPKRATEILDRMAGSLGEKIDHENEIIKKILEADKITLKNSKRDS